MNRPPFSCSGVSMSDAVITLGGQPVFLCAPDGPLVTTEADAVELLGGLWGQEIDWLVLPTGRLSPDFLRLRTGLAGAVIQKFVTYGARLAIVGDITSEVAASDALRDFVRESNSGAHVWFLPDLETLERRLVGA